MTVDVPPCVNSSAVISIWIAAGNHPVRCSGQLYNMRERHAREQQEHDRRYDQRDLDRETSPLIPDNVFRVIF